MGNVETNPTDRTAEIESETAAWRVFLDENFDQLIEGMPKRPEGWWQNLPECPVLAMFELFPLARSH
jgi:hypothetical protein